MMSIQERLDKIKPYYTLMLILATALLFFTLGRLSVTETIQKTPKNPLNITYLDNNLSANLIDSNLPISSQKTGSTTINTKSSGYVIGSKTGKKYYYPWCGTVKRIKIQNQIRFENIEEAKKAGFTPGGNCKGLY